MTVFGALTRDQQVEHVVQAAGLSPSIHNTQPWSFAHVGDALALEADRSRSLPVTDPSGRQLVISCGSALGHARAAARGLGLSAAVQLLPDPARPDLLALLDLSPGPPPSASEVQLATAILHRHTFRGTFPGGGLPDGLLEVLRQVAEREDVTLSQVSRHDDLLELEVLLSRADDEQQRDPAHARELAGWLRDGPAEDGLPTSVVDQVASGSSLRQRDFTGTHPSLANGSAPEVDHPVVVVLTTSVDGPQSWLQAGQALAGVLLRAAEHDVQAQPLGQVTDTEGYRERLRVALSLVGVPQLVLRMGVTHEHLVATPRRSAQELLEGRSAQELLEGRSAPEKLDDVTR